MLARSTAPSPIASIERPNSYRHCYLAVATQIYPGVKLSILYFKVNLTVNFALQFR